LRTDPFERADITSNTYYDWFLHHAYLIYAAQGIALEFANTFKDFPPRQKAASFTIDQALEKMTASIDVRNTNEANHPIQEKESLKNLGQRGSEKLPRQPLSDKSKEKNKE
jgi:arylsulfatase